MLECICVITTSCIRLTDAAVVCRDGTIFFTDASYKYPFKDNPQDVLEARPYGRLLKYDPNTRSTTTLLDNLYFANGIALSSNEDFLVFCETTLYIPVLSTVFNLHLLFLYHFILFTMRFDYDVCFLMIPCCWKGLGVNDIG